VFKAEAHTKDKEMIVRGKHVVADRSVVMDKGLVSFSVLVLLMLVPLFGQWEADQRLTFDGASSSVSSQSARCIAATGDTLHVVWWDSRDGNSEIYYKRSTNAGTSWGSDTRLTDDAAISALPTIAVSGLTLHVAWYDTRDGSGNFEVYYKRSSDGGRSWGPDTRLTNDPAFSWYPSVALSGTNVHLVWRESRDGNYEVYYKRSTDAGVSWQSDSRLTDAAGSSESPSVAAVPSGDVHVAWFDNRDGGAYEIYYKRSTDHGSTWGTDQRLTNDPGVSFGASVALSGPNVHIAFQDSRDGQWEIYYKRSTDGGATWGTDTRLTNATATSEHASIVASGPNAHLVWWDNRDANYEIYYKRSTTGGTSWEADTRLTNDASWSQQPFIAVSGPRLHVVWKDGRDGNDEIYYKRNPTGNPVRIDEQGNDARSTIHDARLKIHPNPFRNRCDIRFTMQDARYETREERSQKLEAGLRIFDASGRIVKTFAITNYHSPITIHWNACDQEGAALPPGVYFVNADAGVGPTVRIVKVR